MHLLHPSPFNALGLRLLDERVPRHDDLVGHGVGHVVGSCPPKRPLAKARDHLAAVEHGPNRQSPLRAAILLHDDAVLRYVHEAPGEVARICRLKRGIG